MILVDTSVWADHLRVGNPVLKERLERDQVLVHPAVIGELAMGALRQRSLVLTALQDLPSAQVAADWEVLRFVERHAIWGKGIGYIDAQLLAAVSLTPDAMLWTRDKRLAAVADGLCLLAAPH